MKEKIKLKMLTQSKTFNDLVDKRVELALQLAKEKAVEEEKRLAEEVKKIEEEAKQKTSEEIEAEIKKIEELEIEAEKEQDLPIGEDTSLLEMVSEEYSKKYSTED